MPTTRTLLPLILLALCNAAGAQTDQPPPQPPPAPPPTDETPITSRYTAPGTGDSDSRFRFTLMPRAEYAFAADIKESPGRVSVARAGVDAELSYAASERLGFSLGVIPEVSWYNFSNATGLIAGEDEPFNDFYRVDIVPGVRYGLDENWALVGGGVIEFAGEAGADIGKSLTYGGYFGARYKFSDTFSTTFGIVGKTRLEDSAIFLPLLGLEWRITDALTLATNATGVKLASKLDEQWTVYIAGAYESRDFRLEDEGPLSNGVVRDRRVPIKVGVDWSACANAVISLEGGAIAWQEFIIDDQNSDEVAEDHTKVAPFIGVSVRIKF